MEYENRMEQHYAVSKSGVLVHINEAHDNKEDCFCPHCGCRMLKRCGNIRAWHFAHDYRYENDVNKECSYESYLHAFAKLRLKQWFEESKSIYLHYNVKAVCQYAKDCLWKGTGDECSQIIEKTFDLKTRLTQCKLEEPIIVNEDRFRADLLWSNPVNPNNDILIEIKVTHECSQKKKESQKRIIEFEVHSEEDVENIVSNDIIRESDIVKFYGFAPKDVSYEAITPRHSLSKFFYYRSGKVYINTKCDCEIFRKRRAAALLEVTVNDKDAKHNISVEGKKTSNRFSLGRFYNWGLALARSKGCDVRNCYLCNHRQYDYDEEKLTCDLVPEEPCEALTALRCSKYSFDDDSYQKYLDDYKAFYKHNIVDVWFVGKEDNVNEGKSNLSS